MVGADTTHRVQEKKWQEVFTALRDVLINCPSCKSETFIETNNNICKCVNCGHDIQKYPVLKVKKYNVVLAPGKKVHACHVIHDSDDFKDIKGEVVTSRTDTSLIGLKNDSDNTWTAILPNGTTKPYARNQVIKIGKGLKINFGNGNEGEII